MNVGYVQLEFVPYSSSLLGVWRCKSAVWSNALMINAHTMTMKLLINSDWRNTNHFNESMSTLTVWCVVYFCAMEIMFEKNNVQYDHMVFFYCRATGNMKFFNSEWTLAWHRNSETGSRVVASTDWTTEPKCQNAFIRTHFATCSNIHKLPGVWCLLPVY